MLMDVYFKNSFSLLWSSSISLNSSTTWLPAISAICFSFQEFTTEWKRLEVGITMGCSISPVLFVAADEFKPIPLLANQSVQGLGRQYDQICQTSTQARQYAKTFQKAWRGSKAYPVHHPGVKVGDGQSCPWAKGILRFNCEERASPPWTGRKWQADQEVSKDIGRRQHQEIIRRVQVGRAGLGWGDSLQ